MSKHCMKGVWIIYILVGLLASCSKKDLPIPTGPVHHPVPNPPQDGGQPQAQTLTIKVQAVIKIGDIVYDHIPASFTLTSFDSTNQPHMLMIRLKPGVNEITIPANHIRYRLSVKEWNQTDEMTLDRKDMQEDVVYTLGGSRAAKKIQYEINAVLVNGQYRADSKTVYQYDVQGKLVNVSLLKKRNNGDIYTALSEDLIYDQTKVKEAIRKDETGAVINKLHISYDQQGKIIAFEQLQFGETSNAAVKYTNTSAGVETHVKHQAGNGFVDYYLLQNKGNQVKRSSVTSGNVNEWSEYGYDTNINPYIHINWPDLMMSRNSKNNVSWTGKSYFSGNLTLDPVEYNYTYDAEGYPVSLVKVFRSAQTGSILNTTKTTYHY